MISKGNPEMLQKNGQNSQKFAEEIWKKGYMDPNQISASREQNAWFHQISTRCWTTWFTWCWWWHLILRKVSKVENTNVPMHASSTCSKFGYTLSIENVFVVLKIWLKISIRILLDTLKKKWSTFSFIMFLFSFFHP